jgi:hypothetical protein
VIDGRLLNADEGLIDRVRAAGEALHASNIAVP